jgi:fructose/tagatose bisphosphate aldolase
MPRGAGQRLHLADVRRLAQAAGENIAETARIAELAHAAGISCEGEIGFVGYSGGEASAGTDPEEAARFARESGVDAMAISVGNVHLQQDREGGLDEDAHPRHRGGHRTPLVIHGGSGVPLAQRAALAARLAHLQVQHRHGTADGLRRRCAMP